MWLDSHCHLTADRFDADRDQTLKRAQQAGVEEVVTIGSGYGIAANQAAVDLARDEAGVYATVGVHPHEASESDTNIEDQLRQWAADPNVVAIGECGLDYHYMRSEREVQQTVFATQVALARELDMPVSIHVRGDEPDAYSEMLDIWCAEGHGDIRGVLHCYTGSLPFARRALEAHFMISFSGIVTFKRSHELREVAKAIPLDRLMLETDAPFLAPEGHRGQRNEPAWVVAVGHCLAELQDCEPQELARITRENAQDLYRLQR